jgi:hypothetical protein
MNIGNPHLSALVIDDLASERLSDEQRARALGHLDRCARCRDDLAATRAAREHFATVVLPRRLPAVRARLAPIAPIAPRRAWMVMAATAVAMLVAIVGGRWRRPVEPNILAKGGFALQVVARRADRVFAVREGARLRARDTLRFVITSATHPYLMVASIDGAGQPDIYYPYAGDRSARLDDVTSRIELPGAVELDDAHGPERLFALASDAPLAAADVRAALTRLGAAGDDAIRATRALPIAAATQSSLLFEKE